MASFTIRITGNPGAAIQSKIDSIKKQANDIVQFAGLNCEGLAKQACPVGVSGRLRSSIKYTKQTDSSCTCGTPVKYAPFVEHGTYGSRDNPYVGSPTGMKPRPYLHPAFVLAEKQCLAELKAIK